jgi:hypothetical protein
MEGQQAVVLEHVLLGPRPDLVKELLITHGSGYEYPVGLPLPDGVTGLVGALDAPAVNRCLTSRPA